MTRFLATISISLLLILGASWTACAQRPQDNWYLETTWVKTMAATNGGLSAPYGVAIGKDQHIYVGDEGYGRVQVYNTDGSYIFSITNGFGGGQAFLQPRGMCADAAGNIYVADYGRSAVFIFSPSGGFLGRIGGIAGSGDGQLSGVIDVGVAQNGEVYVLEAGNARVSIFDGNWQYVRKWGSSGSLDGQLYSPYSLAASPDGFIYIAQCPSDVGYQYVKRFSQDGVFITKWSFLDEKDYAVANSLYFGPTTVRFDPSGIFYVLQSYSFGQGPAPNPDTIDNRLRMYARYGSISMDLWYLNFGSSGKNTIRWSACAAGPDGSVVFCSRYTQQLLVFRRALRDQWAMPRNAPPMPIVSNWRQRPSSPLVDIDYQVTDADDTNVWTAMLIFTNATQSLACCIRYPTWAENTGTNMGPNTAANQPHRLTWNAGADCNANLCSNKAAILAKDSRQGLLDIHYLRLPADRGMQALKISRSPLIQNDFMQVWWWLLATGDPGIALAAGKILGVGGAYDTKLLCDSSNTTSADGRNYIYAKMNVREATSNEVQWAREGATAGNVNQWTPTRTVGGRPAAVNEYGFDTGSWGTNAFWVVPTN